MKENLLMSKIKNWGRSLGPGVITAALVFGPSKMTITSKLGAIYGYSLLWVVAVVIFFMIVFTSMASRIGIATNESLLSVIRQKWGKTAALFIGFGMFAVCSSFQAGNAIGIGISIGEATGTANRTWIIVFTLLAIGFVFFRSFYKMLEKIMLFLVSLTLFAFVTTLVLVKPDYAGIAKGMEPQVPAGSLGLVIAFVASTFSVGAAFYQSYLVQEKRRNNPGIHQTKSDSFPGILILGLMSAIVLICGATVLHPQGIKVNSASDMAKALEPIFGKYASRLFLAGLFSASFSAFIGNASVGGTLLGDALGYGCRLDAKGVRYLVALIMITGATVAIIFGKLPLELIVFAQSVTIFVVPFIGIIMYLVANDGNIMKSHKNNTTARLFGALGLLLLIVLAIMNIKELFFKP